jgi:hypothetical protein
MVVEERAGGRFSAASPKVLIPSAGNFDVDPTGQRFLILKQERPEQLQAVVNWFGELTQRVSR